MARIIQTGQLEQIGHLKNKDIYIYGLGVFGLSVFGDLNRCGVSIKGIIDMRGGGGTLRF